MASTPRRYVVAAFPDPRRMLIATERVRALGIGRVDTHSPYPLRGLEQALGIRRSPVPFLVLVGAMLGAVSGYSLIVYVNAIDWAFNVGNRHPHAPPANIPVTFELAVLFGAGFAFFGLLIILRLPRPYHPVFDAPAFAGACVDSFAVSVELRPGEEPDRVSEALRADGASQIDIVLERT